MKARRNALRLNGASAEREADLGESLVAAANGVVTAEAKAAFERALTHDARSIQGALLPRRRRAAGRAAASKAAAIWREMLAGHAARFAVDPDGARRRWRSSIDRRCAPSAPGPSAEDVAAANADEAGRPRPR